MAVDVVAVVLVVIGAGTWVAVDRITTPLARPVPRVHRCGRNRGSRGVPSLPWPAKGQGAVAVPSVGFTAQSGPESSVPIASLTKITTAVVILRDHPLPAGADGPVITVTAADAAEYQNELHNDESTIAIQAGETLTERQMLEAMMSQSANDIAYSLAVWDAGSLPAFVAKMNALATSLGTTATHYVDASGYDPQTVSSASDVLRLATTGMAIPAFAQIVALPSVTLPLVGTLHNIVSEIGTNGVVGIKSGYTSEAGACMVLAADRAVEGREVLVLVAVLGQPTPPPTQPTTTTTTTRATVPATTTTTTNPRSTTTTTVPANDLPIADPFKYALAHDGGTPDRHVGGTHRRDGGHARTADRHGHQHVGRGAAPGRSRHLVRCLATGMAGPAGVDPDQVPLRRGGQSGRHPGGCAHVRHRRAVRRRSVGAGGAGPGALGVVASGTRLTSSDVGRRTSDVGRRTCGVWRWT